MNYEFAKRLKDAGFPQEYVMRVPEVIPPGRIGFDATMLTKPKEYLLERGITEETLVYADEMKEIKCYTPNLLELIEACGEEFGSLYVRDDGERCYQATNGDGLIVQGKDPTEAVAKLWLALNENKDK